MAYSKQTWDTTSYVNPTRMNHIEDGIYDASTATGTEYSSGVSVKQKIDEFETLVNISDNYYDLKVIKANHLCQLYLYVKQNVTVTPYSTEVFGLPVTLPTQVYVPNSANVNTNCMIINTNGKVLFTEATIARYSFYCTTFFIN